MIKGKVTIDLHNHNSGFTERYEKENMITDAVGMAMNGWIGSNETAEYIMPIASRLLGGLMMFDGTLTEESSNINFPGKDAHLVGYALRDTNSDNTIRGSYNDTESGRTSTGHTAVWDFGTSQANGVIRSLARTYAYPNQQSLLEFIGGNKRVSHNNEVNRYKIAVDYDNASGMMTEFIHNYDSGKPSLKQIYLPTSSYKVADSYNEVLYPNSPIELDMPSANGFFRGYPFLKGGYNGYAYLSYTKKNTSGNGVLKYRRINLETLELDNQEYSLTCANCQFNGGTNADYYYVEDFQYSIINKGHAYVLSADNSKIYIIDMTNPAVIISKSLPSGYSCPTRDVFAPSPLPNGGIQFSMLNSSSKNILSVLYPDGVMVTDTSANVGASTWNGSGSFMLLANAYTWGVGQPEGGKSNYLSTGYLGTICNLDTGVVKTASTSMKVSYTLTDAE